MLQITATNKFGNHCYQESETGELDYPNDASIWTIKTPSAKCLEFYGNKFPLCKTRTYNNIQYLMSSQAYEKIPPEKISSGSACIVQFEHNEKKYFIMTVDNKKYLQNPQGSCNDNESSIDCAIREVVEETNINLDKTNMKELGFYSFESYNEIIDYRNVVTTSVFYVTVPYNNVKHLLLTDPQNEMMIVNVHDYSFSLDETQYVIVIPEQLIESHPDSLKLDKNGVMVDHAFSGHHRQMLLNVIGSNKKYNTSYLSKFVCNFQ